MAQRQLQARAEYDFEAQPGSGELSIRTGEMLTILREGIEGGWVEGRNSKGKVGLFPASYISSVSSQTNPGPPSNAPPPLPASASVSQRHHHDPPSAAAPTYALPPAFDTPSLPPTISSKPSSAPLSGLDAWDTDISPTYALKNDQQQSTSQLAVSNKAALPTNAFDDDFDEEWSDEDEEVAEYTGAHSFGAADAGIGMKSVARSRSTGPDTASLSTSGKHSSTTTTGGGTTKMKNLNRFSNFVKTGMEAYILSTTKFATEPREKHEILKAEGEHFEWRRPSEQYTCLVTKPKKETKMKGLKSFIAYSLTCSLSGIQVSRRYKHFDWLHDQLANKYLLIPIPPLPEKQVAGYWEEDLIEHRRIILQLWVNKICRHPVLSQSEVWKHFITCTDENKWKKGKRLAEKDEYVGGNFFNCITAPSGGEDIDYAIIERQVDQFARSSRALEESCRLMYERIIETQKRMNGPYKANWQKLADAFNQVGQSLELDSSTVNPVKNAIKTSAHVLHKIGIQHEEHGRKDMEQLLAFLFINKGFFSTLPDIVAIHKSAMSKVRENERLQGEGKISPESADQIRQRVDVCSYAMMAELSHLQEERDLDLATMFGSFFSQQAAFYFNLGNQLNQLATMFQPKPK